MPPPSTYTAPASALASLLRTSIQRNSTVVPTSATLPFRAQTAQYSQPRKSCLHATQGYAAFHTSAIRPSQSSSRRPPPSPKPRSSSPSPPSQQESHTDLASLDVLGSVPTPATAIDACTDDGFALNSGIRVSGGTGLLLVDGEAYAWRPWRAISTEILGSKNSTGASGTDKKPTSSTTLRDERGRWDIPPDAWAVLDLVWPKPDLLIIGTGRHVVPLSPQTRQAITELGIRIEVQDTRNAAAQFNLLATERGVEQVAAAMVPVGWK